LNENIKNIRDFPYELNTEKYFRQKTYSVKNIFLKYNFLENIFRMKIFYVKTNRA
jgi:hypothetical protein